MKVFFKHKVPTFAYRHKGKWIEKKGDRGKEESVYYWYWQYLRRNADYLRCCANNGKGKLSALYKDFGDVRDDDFKQWWRAKGVELFAEEKKALIEEVKQVADDGRWYIAVSLDEDKRQLKKKFNAELKKIHTAKRGRRKVTDENSTAKYKVNSHFTLESLKNGLLCYDESLANESRKVKLRIWQMAEKVGLCEFNRESDYSNVEKRAILSATFQRYKKKAEQRIEETANGVFPSV